ncbi:sigma-70 family RNA polymerase sigma factor [Phycicoccus ginsengisoli]
MSATREGAPRTAPEGHEVEALVRAAADGDDAAWEALVRQYVALLWRIALRHGLSESDAADVVQNTWLRLVEHIDDVREPARVASWLSTTAQRESLRVVADRRRVVLADDQAAFDRVDPLQPAVDEACIAREQGGLARQALEALPAPWRSLMNLLAQEPALSYEQIGATLGVPIGSIGPTRGRAVRRLRSILAV